MTNFDFKRFNNNSVEFLLSGYKKDGVKRQEALELIKVQQLAKIAHYLEIIAEQNNEEK